MTTIATSPSTADARGELLVARTRRLAGLEAIIETGLKTFVEVAGPALREIRDSRLYRHLGFGTFQDYCRERWRMSRVHAHRVIEAAAVAENLLPMGNTPRNERQARELAKLTPEQQREVASSIDFSTTTAAEIAVKVDAITTRASTSGNYTTLEQWKKMTAKERAVSTQYSVRQCAIQRAANFEPSPSEESGLSRPHE